MKQPHKEPLSYKDAGVDIDAGNALVEQIKPAVKQTLRPEVLTGLGGFGGLFKLAGTYREPVLVACTDGVGTKLKLAIDYHRHDTVGIDLVAMSVNDLIVQGAEPLFFLDYYATSKLDTDTAARVIEGIAEGCKLSGAALIGGETAEMPGMYQNDDYDLAGFCVGVVEQDHIIDGHRARAGDVLIALGSSGPHSNGYSLIRKVLEITDTDPARTALEETSLLDHLLAPTRIYVQPILKLLKDIPVHALAHITGGGLPENLPRTLPTHLKAVIDTRSWSWPAVFQWLQEQGQISTEEMYRTFNCGVGMIISVPEEHGDKCIEIVSKNGENAWKIGFLEERSPTDTPMSMI